jgi:1-deoxy-D-xylulose-5-phosphate synthase
VLFAIDRAGVVGPDGPTHAGSFDLTYLRCVPNITVMAPADENECRQMLYTGYLLDGPAAVRYPRGSGPGVEIEAEMRRLPIGKGEILRTGHGVALLAFGSAVSEALQAGDALDATVINMRFVKPLDEDMVFEMARKHDVIVTVEDNVIAGGAGSAINECLARFDVQTTVLNLGLPDQFLEHGSREQLLAEAGIDSSGIIASIEALLRNRHRPASGSYVVS